MTSNTGMKVIRRRSATDQEAGIEPAHDSKHEIRVLRAEKLAEGQTFESRAERLAQTTLFTMHWKFPESDHEFLDEPWLRTVFKYFETTRYGKMLIDEPKMDHELERCKRKAKVLRRHGYVYVILPMQSENEAESDLQALKDAVDAVKLPFIG